MIAVEHLTKRYGNVTAVDDLSFEIGDGHVYGFLGPRRSWKVHHNEYYDRLSFRHRGSCEN